ncbi:MAG: CO dehydrogenase/acetyl-CoA synthase complex subunit alpha [Thermodesulfovibrionales bacterium]
MDNQREMGKSATGKSKGIGFGAADMRKWDMTLFERYPPRYHPVNHACCLCALGPCDLNKGRRGACGQEQETFLSREALLIAVTGAAAHAAHARDIVERLLSEHGPDLALDLGEWVDLMMPIARIVTGVKPRRLGDLIPIMDYINGQIVRLLSAAHFGGESSFLDLESKTLHAGTMDILAMEIADVAQISGYGFPKGEQETQVTPIGVNNLSRHKPLILCIGHHSDVGQRLINRIDEEGLDTAIELAGICCTAHDMIRGYVSRRKLEEGSDRSVNGLRIIGNMRDQLRFIRTGSADVVVVDQQCVRIDLLSEALRTGAFFIATSDQSCAGLPDETSRDPEELASEIIDRPVRAVFISDPDRAARLALAIARRYGRVARPSDNKTEVSIWETAGPCNNCGLCSRHCPVNLPVAKAVFTVGEFINANHEITDYSSALPVEQAFGEIPSRCIACGRCESACPGKIPVMTLIGSSTKTTSENNGSIRIGRGPIDDYEIKRTGPSIVLGDIPGVVAFLACPEYHDSRDSVSYMARMLTERGYIVLTAGCAAMDIGIDNLYQRFKGAFEGGSIINLGSCVSASHAIGSLIKVASIFLHRDLDRNYTEIADYILNRVGAVAVMWGGITPKAFAASAGANRLGIPVIFGPQGYKFRRTLEGRGGRYPVFDARSGQRVAAGLSPSHLSVVSKTREDALVQIARLCIRPNDTTWGRQRKLRNYIELSEKLLGEMPHDLADYTRVVEDLPEDRREDLMHALIAKEWQPSFIPDPTLLEGLVRYGNKPDHLDV